MAIKDGPGLEEEDEEEESHIADCRCCCYDLFPFLLFLLSVDGSVYFTFVKNKENINMTRRRRRRRKDRLSFCTHTYSLQGYVCLQRVMIVVVSFFFFFFLFFFVSREINMPMQKIFFLFFFSLVLSFVRSFGLVRREREREKKRKNVVSYSSF